MALDVNGYNASFNAFIKFAQDNITTNKKAVARFGEGSVALGERAITAAAPDADWVGKFRD